MNPELPKLTDKEKAALDEIPDDAVSHWLNGEKWDFKAKAWIQSDTEGETEERP